MAGRSLHRCSFRGGLMGRVHNDTPGVITVEGSGSETRWSSDFPPVNLLPEADWIETSLSVAFPDFTKFVNYGHSRWWERPHGPDRAQNGRPSESGDTCVSITMIEPENRVLGPTDIGTIPADANYIDVRVKLSRTNDPYSFRDQTVPPLIPDEWVSLPGAHAWSRPRKSGGDHSISSCRARQCS